MKPFEIIEIIKMKFLNTLNYQVHYSVFNNAPSEEIHSLLLDFEKKFLEENKFLFEQKNDRSINIDDYKDKILFFNSVKKVIQLQDTFFLSWLNFRVFDLFHAYVESHPKPTGEMFYSIGMTLMEMYDSYIEEIEFRKKYNNPNDANGDRLLENQIKLSLLKIPSNPLYLESMEFRAVILKSFIYKLSYFSVDLKNEIKVTEEELVKFKELNKPIDIENSKPKQSQKLWNVHTRYELLSSKFPNIINTLNKITPASNRNKLLAQIMGINEDTAKSLYNGNYKHVNNDSELKDMNDFLNKINTEQ